MKSRKIGIIIEGRVAYERNVLLGIRDFAAQRPEWILRLELPGRHVKRFVKTWQPDGILFQSAGMTAATRRALLETGCPAIHVSESRDALPVPCVGLDNQRIGQLAAEYFLGRAFRNFAFVGVRDAVFSRARRDSFVAGLRAEGRSALTFELPASRPGLNLKTERCLRNWLVDLPKPCALFAVHDECSLLLATLAREEGIQVPEDIAILGSDDDSLVCELASPKLSSICVPDRRVGWVAAERLAAMLEKRQTKGLVLLPPQGIAARQSTDVRQTEDETVNRVLRYIAAEFHRRLNVEEILRTVGVSRRVAERGFKRHLGRSPLQELHRHRVEYARYLLLNGREPLHRIADRCGFADASQFVNVFRRQTGMTPGRFRRKTGSGG